MKKLEALKVGEVKREEKRKKNTFYEFIYLFIPWYFFITPFDLHFKDDF
jgi:hypothetical protein